MKEYSIELCPFGYRVVETDGDKRMYLLRTTRTGFVFCGESYRAIHYKKRETAVKHAERLSMFARWKAAVEEEAKTR